MAIESASAKDGFAITPSDSTTFKADALYVGTGGNVTVITWKNQSLLFSNVPAGYIIPITCSKVMSTGTTASNIVGLVY